MLLISSLLEMKRHGDVKRIMKSISSELLKKIMIKTFKKYKMLYGKIYVRESLNHVRIIKF